MMGSVINTEMSVEHTGDSALGAVQQSKEFTAFISALEEDGLYNETTSKISVVDNRIIIDGTTLDTDVASKYLGFLKGETNIELEFN